VAARNRARRAPVRRNGELMWTASSSEPITITPGSFLDFPVLDVIADLDNPVGQEHVTLLRMRGYLCVLPLELDAATIPSFMAAALVLDDDEDSSTTPPGTVGTYTHEDVLWTWGGMFFCPSAVPIDYVPSKDTTLDIKSKRRLRSGEGVHIVIQNVGSVDIVALGVIRALSKRR